MLYPSIAPESPRSLRLLRKKKARAARAAIARTPPTTPPAIAPVFFLVPPLPPLVVEEGFGDVLVPEVDTAPEPPELAGSDEAVLEMETVGGFVGVASGSLPAAFASTGSNVVVSFRYAQCGTDELKGMDNGYCVT